MNIYRRKDGRFEGRVAVGQGRKYRSFYGRTKGETKEKILSYLGSFLRETQRPCLTVEKLFEEWLSAAALRVKESTLANYSMRARAHILPAFGNLRTDELTAIRIRTFVDEKISEGLTANYVADLLATLKSILRFGASQHGIPNPLSDMALLKRQKPKVQLLTEAQQAKLKQYLASDQSLTALGVALSFCTGLRIGELCALKWSDIDLEGKTLTVSRIVQRVCNARNRGTHLVITAPKSTASQRVIPLPECLEEKLSEHRMAGEFFVLSGSEKPVEPRTMQYRFQAILKKEKLPSIHFHALRHMFATNCVELGFDVKSLSELLGHSGVEITLNSYVHSSLERKKQFMRRLSLSA